MSISLERPKTKPEALELKVAPTENPRQFWIENDHTRLEDHHAEYVSFSGYFGQHDPHIFAAAPDLAKALSEALELIDDLNIAHPLRWDNALRKARINRETTNAR